MDAVHSTNKRWGPSEERPNLWSVEVFPTSGANEELDSHEKHKEENNPDQYKCVQNPVLSVIIVDRSHDKF
jgi:hypothetical protein